LGFWFLTFFDEEKIYGKEFNNFHGMAPLALQRKGFFCFSGMVLIRPIARSM